LLLTIKQTFTISIIWKFTYFNCSLEIQKMILNLAQIMDGSGYLLLFFHFSSSYTIIRSIGHHFHLKVIFLMFQKVVRCLPAFLILQFCFDDSLYYQLSHYQYLNCYWVHPLNAKEHRPSYYTANHLQSYFVKSLNNDYYCWDCYLIEDYCLYS
jgi:hypothetical protein